MIPLNKALKLVSENVRTLGVVGAKLTDALGCASVNDVRARFPNPRFDNSSMDGYAVIVSDCANASTANPVVLKVIGDLPAGCTTPHPNPLPKGEREWSAVPSPLPALSKVEGMGEGKGGGGTIQSGQTIKIMTGAPIPKSADAVVAVEDTCRAENNVKIMHAPTKGEFVRFAGEDIKEGEQIIGKGEQIGPAQILALATEGIDEIEVVRRPKVAVIATGDELVSFKTPHPFPSPQRGEGGGEGENHNLDKGQIYNSSSAMLFALIKSAGAVAFDLGIARDDPKIIEEKISEALSPPPPPLPHGEREGVRGPCDMVLLTGGVSVGDYDMNRGVLEKMGWREIFWRVAIKPGKPLAFGTIEGKPIFGLPGNPISTMTAFELFVHPAIKKMMGEMETDGRRLTAKLTNDVEQDKNREQLLLANLTFENGTALVTAHGPQSSAHLKPALSANCLARIPSGQGIEPSGSIVEIWKFS